MINQPQEDIKIPENLKKAIENSRNIVTINEAESARLRSLIISSEYTIRQLHNQEVDLDEKIKILTGTLDILEDQKLDLEKYISDAEKELEEVKKNSLKRKEEIELLNIGLDKKDKENELYKKDLDEKKKEIEDKEKELLERELLIDLKEQKLKDYFK